MPDTIPLYDYCTCEGCGVVLPHEEMIYTFDEDDGWYFCPECMVGGQEDMGELEDMVNRGIVIIK